MKFSGTISTLTTILLFTTTQAQNYQYGQDAGHLSVSASANTTSPKVHMMPAPSLQFKPQSAASPRRSGTPIFVNNLSGLQSKPASIAPYLPHQFSYNPNPNSKIQIDSQPRELANKPAPTPAIQSPLLTGINNLNSSSQLPLNLSMVIGKALKKKQKKKKRLKKKRRQLRQRQEIRNLLGFQKNYPFSNKYFGQTFPKFVPDAMYFNPVSHDNGGLPKLELDTDSRLPDTNTRNGNPVRTVHGGQPRFHCRGPEGAVGLSEQLRQLGRAAKYIRSRRLQNEGPEVEYRSK